MILNKILEKKRIQIEKDKQKHNIKYYQDKIKASDKSFIFEQALKREGLSIIAEIKKASPSKGVIDQDFDYLKIASEYEKAKVDAISILCEQDYFLGNIKYLNEIRKQTHIPLLCKDFIIDEYQIYQAAYHGADAILLIVRILDLPTLNHFYQLATKLGLSCLVECHSIDDINRAQDIRAKIIGVNNRDLATFKVDLNHSIKFKQLLSKDVILVAESGILTNDDYKLLQKHEINACLIGEAFMKEQDKSFAIKQLRGY